MENRGYNGIIPRVFPDALTGHELKNYYSACDPRLSQTKIIQILKARGGVNVPNNILKIEKDNLQVPPEYIKILKEFFSLEVPKEKEKDVTKEIPSSRNDQVEMTKAGIRFFALRNKMSPIALTSMMQQLVEALNQAGVNTGEFEEILNLSI